MPEFDRSLSRLNKPTLFNDLISSARYCMSIGGEFHARLHDPDYPNLFSVLSIRLLLRGIFKTSIKTFDKRLPITIPIFKKLFIVRG